MKEAIGYNAARGDSVNILNSAFNGVVEEPVPPFWEQDRFYALLMAIARYLVIAIIARVMWRKLVQPAGSVTETTLRRLEMEKEAREEEIAAKNVPRRKATATAPSSEWIRNSMVNSCVSWQSRSRALSPGDPPVDE